MIDNSYIQNNEVKMPYVSENREPGFVANQKINDLKEKLVFLKEEKIRLEEKRMAMTSERNDPSLAEKKIGDILLKSYLDGMQQIFTIKNKIKLLKSEIRKYEETYRNEHQRLIKMISDIKNEVQRLSPM